jgi:acyl-CoA reductase-like NAD-dependent aldehyde dehydrogenase
MHHKEALFIGGRWSSPSTDGVIEGISPHTEAPIAAVAAADVEDVNSAVVAARSAFDHGP